MIVEYNIPIRLASVANLREHWSKRYKRTRSHRQAAVVIPRGVHKLPCTVTIIRVGKRKMDGDNLQSACKALRDGIADRLGVDDADDRVQWQYDQKRGNYAAIVKIEAN